MNSGNKNNTSLVKIVFFAGLTLLFTIILFLVIFNEKEEIDDGFRAPVITIRPIRGNLEKTLRIAGFVETGSLITVVPRVSGTLLSLDVNTGDYVNEGDIIAKIDPAPYELVYLQAQSVYLTARLTYNRIAQMYRTRGVSRQNYDETKMAYEIAKAQYDLARLNLDYTDIRSPKNTAVLRQHSVPGALVGTGSPLVTLGDLDDLRIKAAIPEIHYIFFTDNWKTMPVRITVPALGNISIDLKPLYLTPYISAENRSFLAEYEIPGAGALGLRPGMFVNIIFVLEKKEDIIYLPFKVLTSGNRLMYVTEDKLSAQIEFTPVFFNNDYFVIPFELERRLFIIEGQHFINPGQRVNIISEDKR